MWNEGDRDWRLSLWRHMLDKMPVEATINLHGCGFSLRERREASAQRGQRATSIYADDIFPEQYERMLDEWSALLDCGTELRSNLRLSALKTHYQRGDRAFCFAIFTNLGQISVRASFRGDPREEPFVICLGEGI